MDFYRVSPIFRYISHDDFLPSLHQLLVEGADPNSQAYGGVTPLHEAVKSCGENIGVIRELINAGADVNMTDHLGYTSLHFAVIFQKRRTVDALIQSGASVNANTFLGTAPLHLAVTGNHFYLGYLNGFRKQPDTWIIDKLLNHEDIDYNVVDSFGETPLMIAVRNLQDHVVVKLSHSNANPNICNNVSETPLHVAFSQPLSFMEIQLLLSGASIYSVDKKGETPIDILLKNDSRSIWEIMDILKIIVFKCNITDNFKRKLESVPDLSYFLNECCEEVDEMRSDFISGNITVHDFVCNCFNENQFTNILQIHKPIIERLVKNIYPNYFAVVFDSIPDLGLLSILQMTASSKTCTNSSGVIDLAYLLSKMDIIIPIYENLFRLDIFYLIVAFSNVNERV